MADNNTSGRGFRGMKREDQLRAASAGGKATGGKNLTHADRVRGGKNSHGSRRGSSS